MVGVWASLLNKTDVSLDDTSRRTLFIKLGDPGHAMLDRS
jgi:hypothetical protein